MNNSKKSLLSLPPTEAKKYLLEGEQYCTFDLPKYFTFNELLQKVDTFVQDKPLSTLSAKNSDGKAIRACDFDDINYKIISNKDGHYAWRPLQLIHPALYVSLIQTITEKNNWQAIKKRFIKFQKNKKIECVSVPVISINKKRTQASAQILTWWEEVEQKSLSKALDFSYLYTTDITDCYGAIYTHSIAWALHDKAFIKNPINRNNNKLIGNKIDSLLREMSNGQTNGIPQGSVSMDFIAEILLGYADLELTEKLKKTKIKDYHIIRYRDDYRIFVNSQLDGDNIVKALTEVLSDLGLKLNPTKTNSTDNLIMGSIKKDKLNLLSSTLETNILKRRNKINIINNQKLLLQLSLFSLKYPNSGQVKKLLGKFYKGFKIDKTKDNLSVLIAIVTELSYNNPMHYSFCAALLSRLITCVNDDKEQLKYINKIVKKFKKLPNTGFMDIWLQRISYKFAPQQKYDEKLCEIVVDPNIPLWNTDWLNGQLKTIIDTTKIVDENILQNLDIAITQAEVDAFNIEYDSADLSEYGEEEEQ